MKIEIRANDTVHIEGYVNAVGRDSRPLPSPRGKFVEQVAPGTFRRACECRPPQLMLDHARALDADAVFSEDSIGLHVTADIRDHDVAEMARRRELRGWSFGFTVNPGGESWEDTAQPYPRRTLTDIAVSEVSLIASLTPCYAGTSVEVRGSDEVETERRSLPDDAEVTDTVSNIKNALELERRKYEIFKERNIL